MIGAIKMIEKLFRKIISIFPKPIRDLYYKLEDAIMYVFFGALTTLVSFVTQYIASRAGCPVVVSTMISWIFAVTFAFFTNKFYVFKDNRTNASDLLKQAGAFYGARLASLLFEVIFMAVTVDKLHLHEMLMKLIAQIFILIANYLMSKLLIFKNKDNSDKEAADK